jgi:myristoyl-CoA:protein N-myristoyltransferase-like protein
MLEAAYLYYYATDIAFIENAEEHGLLKRRLTELIGDAIVLADQAKFDVFNALTLMDNPMILQDLKVTWSYRKCFSCSCRLTTPVRSSDLEMVC